MPGLSDFPAIHPSLRGNITGQNKKPLKSSADLTPLGAKVDVSVVQKNKIKIGPNIINPQPVVISCDLFYGRNNELYGSLKVPLFPIISENDEVIGYWMHDIEARQGVSFSALYDRSGEILFRLRAETQKNLKIDYSTDAEPGDFKDVNVPNRMEYEFLEVPGFGLKAEFDPEKDLYYLFCNNRSVGVVELSLDYYFGIWPFMVDNRGVLTADQARLYSVFDKYEYFHLLGTIEMKKLKMTDKTLKYLDKGSLDYLRIVLGRNWHLNTDPRTT